VSDASQIPAPHRLEDLKRKMKITGTVKKVELFGAFVDIGVGRDGLVHISAMSAQPINRVEDVVKEGDTVTVWVRRVDPQAGRIDLTMIEPLGLDWDEIKTGQLYKGKVTKLEKFGAFVDIGAERPGLIHISELASYRVEEVNEIVKVGDEVEVKVIGVDPRKRQIKLSIKAVDADIPVEVETEETPLTAMQIALQRAMGDNGSDEQRASNRRSKNRERQRRDQEDILSRTLTTKRK